VTRYRFVFASFLILLLTSCGARALAPGVSCSSIRSIRLGMTDAEVVSILGEPIAREPGYPAGVTTLVYSRPVRGARWYPMVWVHLRNGRVLAAYVKKYLFWGADSVGVYGLAEGQSWESPKLCDLIGR
jgi:hypothetical protein